MRRISLVAWVGGALIAAASLHSSAAGLGRLEVKSVLGEPLRAEVSIAATSDEVASLRARVASPEAYESAGLVYTGIVSQLALTLKQSTDGEPVLMITSAGPINEPVIDLLLELSWSSGRVVRIYTAFVDPPFIAAELERERAERAAAELEEPAHTQAAEVSEAPTPRPLDEEMPVDSAISEPEQIDEPAETPPARQVEAGPVETIGGTGPTLFDAAPSVSATGAGAAEEEMASYAGGESIKVKRGDTLSKLALANKPAGVTLEQMLVVLFRNNPQAFSGKNMNRLRTGKIIELPEASEYSNISAAEARKEVRIQSADWNAYRERLAAAATQQPIMEQPAQQSAAGTVTPTVDDQAPKPSEKAGEVVKLSKGEPGSAAKGGGKQADVQSLQEKLVASEKALKEQTDRVARLEKIIADLQKLAEVQNQDMAQAQAQAAATAGAEQKPSAQAPTQEKPAASQPQAGATPSATPAGSAPEAQPKPEAPTAPSEAASTSAAAPAPLPAQQPGSAEAQAPTAAQQKPKRRPPPPPPPPPPSLVDQVMEQPYLVAIPILVLGLVGFGVSRLRGRKKRQPKATAEEAAPAFAATGSRSTTTTRGAYSPVDTDIGLASTNLGDGSDDVDPLEEAEIFLAYGRDAQAEELLKEALQSRPNRFEIHAKLAEIYAKRGDKGAFERIAREVQQGTGGDGEIWNRVATLGYSIDPNNPRYADGATGDAGSGGGAASDAGSSTTTERLDFDVGLGGDSSAGAPDFDPSATSEFDSESVQVFDPDATMDGRHEFDDAPTMNVRSGQNPNTVTDLDLNLDSSSLGSEEDEGGDTTVTSNAVDFDFNIGDLGEGLPVEDVTGGERTENGDSALDFNIDGISLDSDSGGEPTLDESSGAHSIDLSGISLDLDASSGPASSSPDSSRDEKWYEVQTKFDLAKAYQEMGDTDGAREILQEVISEGDSEQKAAAESVLSSLD